MVLGIVRMAEAGTMFTTPVIFVRPVALEFGAVPTNAIATNTFLVENMGSGKLVGTATVADPFRIISGRNYTLRAREAQVITVIYRPTGAELDTQTVTFTGGGGAEVTATGSLKVPSAKKAKSK